MTDRAGSWRELTIALALVALTVAVFAPALQNGFVWDDAQNITENPTVRTWDGLRRDWVDPYANQQYYPLTHTSFWLQYQLFGLWPAPYVAFNILLQAVAALLLWRVLRQLGVPGAPFAAAIFAIHPLQVETVAWITERKNLLAGVLLFASVLAFLRWCAICPTAEPPSARPDEGTGRPASTWALVLAIALFFLAVAAKSAVATAPAALLVLLWWKRGRATRRDWAALAPMLAIGIAAGLVTAALERHHVGASGSAWSFTLFDRVVLAGRIAWFYLARLVWAGAQLFIYPRWEVSSADAAAWLYPLGAVGALAALWFARRQLGRAPLAAALVYGLLIAPASGFFDVFFFQFSFVQDHFQYFACAAPIALAAGAAAHWARTPARRRAAIALAALLLLALGGASRARLPLFRDNETLWSQTLERNASAWIAAYNLGLIRAEAGRHDEALALYDAALRANPRLARAHHNKGVAYERLGRPDDAAASYALAIALDPRYVGSLNNLGQIEVLRGRVAEALAHFDAAVAAEPGFGIGWFNRGSVLAATGRLDESIPALREAIRLRPDLVPAYEQLARVLARLGRVAEARTLLGECRRRAGAPDPALARALGA